MAIGGGVTEGLLVTLEGLDGVGKTTQLERLRTWLSPQREVLAVREPGGTELGEALREVILHHIDVQSAVAELLVFAAARAELMHDVVRPALNRGAVVLMDRFIDSSVAYQAFGLGIPVETVMTINRVATKGQRPDLTVWLKGDSYLMDQTDRLEKRDREYFTRVHEGYDWLSHEEPDRWLVIDCRQSVDAIFHQIAASITARLNHEGRGELP